MEKVYKNASISNRRRRHRLLKINAKVYVSFTDRSEAHNDNTFYRAMLRRARYCYDKVVCLSVRPSVTLMRYHDHIGWKSSKIISPLVSFGCSLFADPQILTDLL